MTIREKKTVANAAAIRANPINVANVADTITTSVKMMSLINRLSGVSQQVQALYFFFNHLIEAYALHYVWFL